MQGSRAGSWITVAIEEKDETCTEGRDEVQLASPEQYRKVLLNLLYSAQLARYEFCYWEETTASRTGAKGRRGGGRGTGNGLIGRFSERRRG